MENLEFALDLTLTMTKYLPRRAVRRTATFFRTLLAAAEMALSETLHQSNVTGLPYGQVRMLCPCVYKISSCTAVKISL